PRAGPASALGPMSITFTGRSATCTQRWCERQSMSSHGLRPAGPYWSTATIGRSGITTSAIALRYEAERRRTAGGDGQMARPGLTMRIAIDIDSTLHHYWDVLSDAAQRRFGVDLPYEEQFDWGITRLKPDQLRCVIDETHADATILAGRPYPGAV